LIFQLVSRGAHEAAANLALRLAPIGLLTQIVTADSPDPAMFVAVHETIGATVLVLIFAHFAWLARGAPPRPSSV
jgi:cytochrome b561